MRARLELHGGMALALVPALALLAARPALAEEPEKAPVPVVIKSPCPPPPPADGCLNPGLGMPPAGGPGLPPLPPGEMGGGMRPFAQPPEAGTAGPREFAPNIMGDLLLGSRSVSFPYIRSSGNVLAGGSTSITNPSVAEDNSPVPRDRFTFRYNLFDSAIPVQGFGPAVLGLPGAAEGVPTNPPVTKNYDVNQFTFGFEKTFFDGLMSVEVRAPFANTVSSHLTFSSASIKGTSTETEFVPGRGVVTLPVFNVVGTPGNTLGTTRTEFSNMSTIFKAKWYESSGFLASGGFSVGIPTAPDEKVTVIDYGAPSEFTNPTNQHVRQFDIHNDIWSINPFVAFLVQPTSRWFAQGFLQFDLPLNKNRYTFTDALFLAPDKSVGHTVPGTGVVYTNSLSTPFTVNGSVAEQTLMHVNLNTGYWLVQRPEASWITGIAPSLELHYTTTLDNADVATLPGDFGSVINPANPNGVQLQSPKPTIGNLRNRVDILDMTVGTTVLLGDSTTVAVGFAFPLTSNRSDRVYDWEGLVQLNYYFGARGMRGAPNTLGR
jgi:hypothetical protein